MTLTAPLSTREVNLGMLTEFYNQLFFYSFSSRSSDFADSVFTTLQQAVSESKLPCLEM